MGLVHDCNLMPLFPFKGLFWHRCRQSLRWACCSAVDQRKHPRVEKLYHRVSRCRRSETVRSTRHADTFLWHHHRKVDCVSSAQCDVHRRPPECGVRPHPQREEESQRSGPHGSGGRRQGSRGHPGGRHGRHLRHHLPCCRQVSVIRTFCVTVELMRCLKMKRHKFLPVFFFLFLPLGWLMPVR